MLSIKASRQIHQVSGHFSPYHDRESSHPILHLVLGGKPCEDFHKWSQLLDYYTKVVTKMEAAAGTYVRGAPRNTVGAPVRVIENAT